MGPTGPLQALVAVLSPPSMDRYYVVESHKPQRLCPEIDLLGSSSALFSKGPADRRGIFDYGVVRLRPRARETRMWFALQDLPPTARFVPNPYGLLFCYHEANGACLEY